MSDFEITPLLTATSILVGLGFLAVIQSTSSDNHSAASENSSSSVSEEGEETSILAEQLNQQSSDMDNDYAISHDAASNKLIDLKADENISVAEVTDELRNKPLGELRDEQPEESIAVAEENITDTATFTETPIVAPIAQPKSAAIAEAVTNLPITSNRNSYRCPLQHNFFLAQLITQWIGEEWITQPQNLKQLEALMQNTQFCSDWWQVRQTIKQNVAHSIRQQTGIEVDVHSLFDVQAVPITVQQRQLLNLLHVLTLYIRLKVNATTDTVQRFTHRSVPRTCIFAGQVKSDNSVATSIAQLMQAVADTINNDPEVQGKLQVVVLIADRSGKEQFQLLRQLRAAADLAQYLPLARQTSCRPTPWLFALNGAALLGSHHSSNLKLQQVLGAKHCFLFGKTAPEISHLQSQGYNPMSEYSINLDLQQVIHSIASGYFSYGDTHAFRDLGNWLLNQDPALVLVDYSSYIDCQERVSQNYQDQKHWTRLSILTTARMGQFSFDRTTL